MIGILLLFLLNFYPIDYIDFFIFVDVIIERFY